MSVRATKIIATLGPASGSPATIEALVGAGVDVFRLNFSHGTQAEHAARFHQVREAARRAGRHVAVLQDLSGPKLRTGALEGGRPIALAAGDALTLAIGEEPGRRGRVSTTAAELARAVSAGGRLLLNDGRIELRVESATASEIQTRVVEGGELGERKGIHAPGVPLSPGPTEKDLRDLAFGLALGVDLVALSFVRSADDVARAKQVMAAEGRPNVPLVAKIERSEAIDRLNGILDAADAVMVARGDLGIELPLERVPRVQKEILRLARLRGVPVIVATEVLESMRTEPRPSRAEVSDAAGAVDAGADAIMLSGETAMGQHPVRAVEVLDAIIRDAEQMPPAGPPAADLAVETHHGAALCDAAVTLAARAGATAIVAVTSEGWTARLLAARRPAAPIVAATGRDEVARRLALWRGVAPIVCGVDGDLEEAIARAADAARAHLGLPEGATLVFVNARPDLDRGGANFVRLRRV
jgi:pyruvate kinase